MKNFLYSVLISLGIVSLIGLSPFEVPEIRGQISPLVSFNSAITTGPSISLITSQSVGGLRNNFTGCVGFSSQISPGADITVTDLGRWVTSGNSGTHEISLVDALANTRLAFVTVNTSGATANDYVYGSITPVTLTHSKNYNLFSKETNGGDQWGDSNSTTITTTTAVSSSLGQAATSAQADCTSPSAFNSRPNVYVPPNLKYHL